MLSLVKSILIIVAFVVKIGDCLYCYECSTDTEFGSQDACASGKTWYLRRVECRVPSVCATYSFTTLNQGRPSITAVARGCQANQYGATCEDIFNDLRGRGSFHHGHHKCSTCTTDFCNSSGTNGQSFHFILICSFISIYICKCLGIR